MAQLYVCPRGHHKVYHNDASVPTDDDAACPFCGARGTFVRVPTGFEILSELGRGGMGMVYKVYHEATDRVAAFKIINPFVNAIPENFERFVNEAAAVTNIDHPNIVKIYDIGQIDGLPFFSLEFVEGGCLSDLLRDAPIDFRRAASLVQILAVAINSAHERGIIHRDLKPANILLTGAGEPKIADFGLAKFLNESQDLTRTGIIMGTPSYMSPEQARGEMKEAGPGADIYALGVILFQAITGQPPLRGDSEFETLQLVVYEEAPRATRINPDAPAALEAICAKCLQKNSKDRYLTALELGEDLSNFLLGEAIKAPPVADRPPIPIRPSDARKEPTVKLALKLDPEESSGPPDFERLPVVERVKTLPLDAKVPDKLELKDDSVSKLQKAQRIEFLRGLNPAQLDTLSRCGCYRTFEPGETIFEEGDPALGLFIILRGSVDIFGRSSDRKDIPIAKLEADEVFGEMGLVIASGRRTASARAIERTTVFELPGNPVKLIKLFSQPETTMQLVQNLISMLRMRLQQRDRARLDLLREYVPGVSDHTLAQKVALKVVHESLPKGLLRTYSSTKRLKPAEVLFKQGDDPDGFYFVQTGRLDILRADEKGELWSVGQIAAPNIVGEVGFFSGEKRTATVRAIEPVSLVHFSGSDFNRLRKKDPEAALNVMFAAAQLAVHLIVQRHVM